MLAGQMRSPLWLLSRLVLIPKPADHPSAPPAPGTPPTPVTLRPLGLPEIFYRLAGRAAVRIVGPLVGPTMEPVQLGVGIPFGCQIGAKGAQCAFDARKAVSTWDGVNAFNTEPRQDIFSGVAKLAPRLLRYFVWGYGRPTPLLWRGQLAGWSGTGVKQGDPAGPLYFAVSTYPLFCSIRDAAERVVNENFPLMPSYVGVTAICDDLQITCDPQLALPVSEVVQRKFAESGRGLNLAKCRILVHPDSAHLVVWPPAWRPGLCAAIPIETNGAKLLGAPVGTEPFRTDFVEKRVSKATASVTALEHLPPWATWTVLRFCINERVNYLAQVTEFPLVQDSLAQMDSIIDHALLRAGGLPLEPPNPLTHLTTLTLRSLPTELGGLGIRRYSGLAGEIACLRGRTVYYEFAERFAPELLAGATEDFWPPIVLGAAENSVWTEVAGLFREDAEDDSNQPLPSTNAAGLFRAFYLATGESSPLYGFTNPAHSAAERRNDRIMIRGAAADIKATGRKINGVRFDALVQLLHSRGRLAESCFLKSNRFPRSGCWLAGPGGFFAGSTNLSPAEYRISLRIRLLRSPASSDVGDAEGGVLCRCNRRISLVDDPLHFFHCPSSQGQYIRRHDHIRDSIVDLLGEALRPEHGPYDVEVEPRVRAHISQPPADPTPPLPADGAMEVDANTTSADPGADSEDVAFIEEAQRPYRPQMSIQDLRQRNLADKAAGQCRGDIGIHFAGARTLVDVAVADATAPSYRTPPPRTPPSPDVPVDHPPPVSVPATRAGRPRAHRRRHRGTEAHGPPSPRLPGQSFAIEHRVWAKKSKFRPFLGTSVDDPRCFVPFVLEASGRLGAEAGAFLEYLRTCCPFPILRFRALASIISAKHNARMGALPPPPDLGCWGR